MSSVFRLEAPQIDAGGFRLTQIALMVRLQVFRRDHYICRYCHKVLSDNPYAIDSLRPTLDHVVPRSRGGTNDITNLMTACRECNEAKGSETAPVHRQKSGATRLAEMKRWFQ